MKFIIFCLLFSTFTLAKNYIYFPQKGEQCRKIGTYVFSASDRAYLIRNKKYDLACAQITNKKETNESFLSRQLNIKINSKVDINRDKYHHYQWAIHNSEHALKLDELPIEKGEDIIVAVLDTGVDYHHPDLDGAIYQSKKECNALIELDKCQLLPTTKEKLLCQEQYRDKDFDGNGYPLDCSGWNLVGSLNATTGVFGDNDATDRNGHGTHIAGIIAAKKNAIGIQGVSNKVKILPVKIIDAFDGEIVTQSTSLPSPRESDLPKIENYGDIFARGILYAIRSKAKIINMSFAFPKEYDNAFIRSMIELAIEKEIYVVASAANDSTSHTVYPCSYEDVICVGSIDADGSISNFSNYGSAVDINAPGAGILSTYPLNNLLLHPVYFTEREGYEYLDGTSQSTPYIVGALARITQYFPGYYQGLYQLYAGANQGSRFQSSDKKFVQYGNLDLKRSLTQQKSELFQLLNKGINFLQWEKDLSSVSGQVRIRNLGADATNINVDLKASLNNWKANFQTIHFDKWNHGEVKSFNLNYEGLNIDVDSEFHGILEIKTQKSNQEIAIYHETIKVISPKTKTKDMIEFPLQANHIFDFSKSINTVIDYQGQWPKDYIQSFHDEDSRSLSFKLFRSVNGKYISTDEVKQAFSKGNILGYYKFDIDLDGDDEYIIMQKTAIRKKSENGERNRERIPGVKFYFFDNQFQPKAIKFAGKKGETITYANTDSILNNKFRWLFNGKGWIAAWVGIGDDLNKVDETFNPWKPKNEEEGHSRVKGLFYIDTEGVNLWQFPEGVSVHTMLHPTSEETQKSNARILLSKGEDFLQVYYTYNLQTAQYELVEMDVFHQLDGLSRVPFFDLKTNEILGSGFASQLVNGSLKIGNIDKKQFYDVSIHKSSHPENLNTYLGGFSSENSLYTFAFDKFNLSFMDHKTGEHAYASKKRFSFMPGFIADRFYFPLIIEQRPAIYVPPALGVSWTAEVIIAQRDEQNGLKLYRPAKYRLLPSPGKCEELNPLVNPNNKKSYFVFACENSVKLLPL